MEVGKVEHVEDVIRMVNTFTANYEISRNYIYLYNNIYIL